MSYARKSLDIRVRRIHSATALYRARLFAIRERLLIRCLYHFRSERWKLLHVEVLIQTVGQDDHGARISAGHGCNPCAAALRLPRQSISVTFPGPKGFNVLARVAAIPSEERLGTAPFPTPAV